MSVRATGDLSFTTETTGAVIAPVAGFATLPAGTYYAIVSDPEYRHHATQFEWGAALAATITYERTLQPDAALSAAAGTIWEDTGVPPLSIVAGAAGTRIEDFVNQHATKMRVKVVVGTEGTLRGNAASKGG